MIFESITMWSIWTPRTHSNLHISQIQDANNCGSNEGSSASHIVIALVCKHPQPLHFVYLDVIWASSNLTNFTSGLYNHIIRRVIQQWHTFWISTKFWSVKNVLIGLNVIPRIVNYIDDRHVLIVYIQSHKQWNVMHRSNS